ncbi:MULTISPECIES: PAAR domain-containing protein [Stenotrophomonas]|uniref:PAAR domain-containing protein n=1 Tax=Stenotrophomonas TaxID=40323 RepID=UPI0018D4BC6A|nr:PAAR domain-containing protein [Stenotrophomonas sp.]MBH1509100.1 PAAR domain-containing protein [Stenotrophomonas maltophilia]
MARPFIVVGDKLSHGGSVVAGTGQTDINGKAVARVGDGAVCAVHGATTIVSGDATVLVDGQPVARDGDRTACGATLMASQATTGLR